jgi:hypothetical protein
MDIAKYHQVKKKSVGYKQAACEGEINVIMK